ncbi:MAG: DUF4143 domain-containing protein [Gammaproteobacteria bacterium]|nr:DUF4143 domain-containing protein [Gammaproteobacteria bacterium]
MYDRIIKTPLSSTFLFGPRGTGKSTWLRQRFKDALVYDLLDSETFTTLVRQPQRLFQEVSAAKPERVVIDEVQRVPELLNEVHRLIEGFNTKFVLSGSSARKIRRAGTNLLAGRARMRSMFTLTSAELQSDFDPERVMQYGSLPSVFNSPDVEDYLRSYGLTYLSQEIQAEAQVQNIGGFSRFLEIAARQNGQPTNMTKIAQDAQVARTTVQTYFKILEDTLLGFWLPAWKLKLGNKQVQQSKFYFFDCGVVRSLSGRLPYPVFEEERGALFETMVLNELRAYMSYQELHYPIYFYRTYDGTEVDFVFEGLDGFVAIEAKSASRWDRKFSKGLNSFVEKMKNTNVQKIGIYQGTRQLLIDDIRVYPVIEFLEKLWAGEIVG